MFWLRGMPLLGLGTLSRATLGLAGSIVVPVALILVAHLKGKSSLQPNLKLYPLVALSLSFGEKAICSLSPYASLRATCTAQGQDSCGWIKLDLVSPSTCFLPNGFVKPLRLPDASQIADVKA